MYSGTTKRQGRETTADRWATLASGSRGIQIGANVWWGDQKRNCTINFPLRLFVCLLMCFVS